MNESLMAIEPTLAYTPNQRMLSVWDIRNDTNTVGLVW
jgi:hypothetical protein